MYKPQTISEKKTIASIGLPSSKVTAPIETPNRLSHCDTNLDPIISIQSSGIQTAPVTLPRWRESLQKRKTANPNVSSSARREGICTTIALVQKDVLAGVGAIKSAPAL